ncbi:uncharacterized protein CXQ87_002091 [Candidozyma duobushaemuli]|nr:uncharacterized protein CXQ87_002091 [[Candida] duobushaemulonis]PVH13969.1 hypothetical protein CXQ87_002091 [[Candida] duobushaemulonis]
MSSQINSTSNQEKREKKKSDVSTMSKICVFVALLLALATVVVFVDRIGELNYKRLEAMRQFEESYDGLLATLPPDCDISLEELEKEKKAGENYQILNCHLKSLTKKLAKDSEDFKHSFHEIKRAFDDLCGAPPVANPIGFDNFITQ